MTTPAPTSSPGVGYLLDTIRALEKRAACLLELTRFVGEKKDSPDLLSRLLAKSLDLVGADAGAIALADKATKEFSFVAVHYASLPPMEAEAKEEVLRLLKVKLAEGILGKVFASGEPVLVSEPAQEKSLRKDLAEAVSYEVKSLMAVPITAGGERLGVMELLNKVPEGPFNSIDVELALAVAGQAALLAEAHRLRENLGGRDSSPAVNTGPTADAREIAERRLLEVEEKARKAEASLREELEEARRSLAKAEEKNGQLLEEIGKAADTGGERERALEKELSRLRGEWEQSRKEAEESLSRAREELEALRKEKAEAEKKIAAESKEAVQKELEGLRKERDDWKDKAGVLQKEKAEAAQRDREAKEALAARSSLEEALKDAREQASRFQEKTRHLSEDLETAFRLQEKTRREADELARAVEERQREIVRPMAHREALMKALSVVSSNEPLDVILDVLLNSLGTMLDVEGTSLLLVDDDSGKLYFAAATGHRKDPLKKVLLSEGEGVAGWVARHGKIVNAPDVARDPRFSDQADKFAGFNTKSILAVPLFSDDKLIGVAEAVNKKDGGAFSDEDVHNLIGLAQYGSMVIRKAQLYRNMNNLFLSTVRALADAIEAKGPAVDGRAERVRLLTLALAEELLLSPEGWRTLEIAALLHDVGLLIVPEKVLKKPEGLTEEETRLLTRAPIVAAEILSPAKPLKDVVPLVRHVHERWDGNGYPDKLKGGAIPWGSRIIAAASTYEAMTADRPYRKRLPPDVAVKEIESLKGIQLDPDIVDALVRLYRKGKLKELFKTP